MPRIRGWRTTIGLAVLIAATVFAVFGRTCQFDFVNYDDDKYVFLSSRIGAGLSWQNAANAFLHSHAANWHPITTLSHMFDCEMWGLRAGGHHATSVLLHSAAAVGLFLALFRLTGACWPSATVALLFAVHPLRAESVAWISERKDVLSGLWFAAILWAYARYASREFSVVRYLLVVVTFALGLLSKSMLVTVPGILLLLDYWPLRRFAAVNTRRLFGVPLGLLVEKVPLLLMSAITALATMLAHRAAKPPVDYIPLPLRIANGLISYATYLGQFVWPMNLAPFYPHPTVAPPLWQPVAAAGLLVAITALAVIARRKHPYLLVGWLWYLMMLLPVIGFIRQGDQAHADRYTYLPQIGIAIIVVWSVAQVPVTWRPRRIALPAMAVAAVLALGALAIPQVGIWRNSETLWRHTLQVAPDNWIARVNLGSEYKLRGNNDAAIAEYREAIRIRPDYALALCNIGSAFLNTGQMKDAEVYLRRAVELDKEFGEAYYNLGTVLAMQRRDDEAIQAFRNCLRTLPRFALAHNNLAVVLTNHDRLDEAETHYRQALAIKPDYDDANFNLGNLLFRRGKPDEAIARWRATVAANPAYAKAHLALGQVSLTRQDSDMAISHFAKVIELAPDCRDAHIGLAQAIARQSPKTASQSAGR